MPGNTLEGAVAPAVRALYALPLDRFTAERDELARELRKQGKRDQADVVRALRKPTGAAWAVNQLAHRRRGDVQKLLDAGRRLRDAQEQLLRGGPRQALDDAREQERQLVSRLAQDALAIASEAGLSPTPALDGRIRSTLHAAAVDDETAGELAAGRLVREREAVGFGRIAAPAASAAPRRRAAEPALRRTDEERERSAALQRQLQDARRAHRDATRRAAAAKRAVQRARDQADAAVARLRDAEAEQEDAHQAAEAAQARVSSLEAQLERPPRAG